MGRIRNVSFIGSCPGVHICIVGYFDYVLFEFWMKSGKGFVGISVNELRTNHASNVGRFRCKVCWSQHVFNFKPCKHVIVAASFCTDEAQEEPVAYRVFSCNSHQSLCWGRYLLNEYKLKARNNFQFKVYITNHVVLC